MYSTELKIKRVSLAAESRLIRKDEKRAKEAGNRDLNRSLHEHRVNIVRFAARHAELAHGFLRRKPYRVIERESYTSPSVDEIRKLVMKFGPATDLDPKQMNKAVYAWIEGVGLEHTKDSNPSRAGSIPVAPSN